jgi:hypothetical protein
LTTVHLKMAFLYFLNSLSPPTNFKTRVSPSSKPNSAFPAVSTGLTTYNKTATQLRGISTTCTVIRITYNSFRGSRCICFSYLLTALSKKRFDGCWRCWAPSAWSIIDTPIPRFLRLLLLLLLPPILYIIYRYVYI